MEPIVVGHLVFEPQPEGHYFCQLHDFTFEVKEIPGQGWALIMRNDNMAYGEMLYGLDAENLRVTLRLICGRARLDSEALLCTVRDVWSSLKNVELFKDSM
jgi:hypothetical protein